MARGTKNKQEKLFMPVLRRVNISTDLLLSLTVSVPTSTKLLVVL